MNSNQLEYFIAAAEYQNFTKAAEKYYISQTAVTQQIKSLEAYLGVNLFERSGRHVKLTPSGRVYLQEAKSIMRRIKSAEQKVYLTSCGFTGTVSIGFLKGCEQLGISSVVSQFKESYPGISFQFERGDYAYLFESLNKGENDFVINIKPQKLNELSINYMKYKSSQQYVILYQDHPLIYRTSVKSKELKNQVFVFPNTSPASLSQIYEVLASSEIFPENAIYAKDMESVFLMISVKMGIGIIPEYNLHLLSGFPELKAVPLEKDMIETGIFWNMNNSNTAAMKFRSFLTEVCGSEK